MVEKEKNVITYKFTLLRAVVEIVMEEGGSVSKKGCHGISFASYS